MKIFGRKLILTTSLAFVLGTFSYAAEQKEEFLKTQQPLLVRSDENQAEKEGFEKILAKNIEFEKRFNLQRLAIKFFNLDSVTHNMCSDLLYEAQCNFDSLFNIIKHRKIADKEFEQITIILDKENVLRKKQAILDKISHKKHDECVQEILTLREKLGFSKELSADEKEDAEKFEISMTHFKNEYQKEIKTAQEELKKDEKSNLTLVQKDEESPRSSFQKLLNDKEKGIVQFDQESFSNFNDFYLEGYKKALKKKIFFKYVEKFYNFARVSRRTSLSLEDYYKKVIGTPNTKIFDPFFYNKMQLIVEIIDLETCFKSAELVEKGFFDFNGPSKMTEAFVFYTRHKSDCLEENNLRLNKNFHECLMEDIEKTDIK